MATTTGYTLTSLAETVADFITADPDVVGLANGGYVVAGTHGTHIDTQAFDANGASTGSATGSTGTNTSLAGLNNGNYVVVGQDADSIVFNIYAPNGGLVAGPTDIGDVDSTNADVAALNNGGFVIVTQDAASGGHIDLILYDAGGAQQNYLTVHIGGDSLPSVAVLDNGNIAVAWQHAGPSGLEIWTAVYTQAGAVVKAPALLDDFLNLNANPTICAVNNGFVVAYEDDGWGGGVDITLARLDASGNFINWWNMSDAFNPPDGSADRNPALARVSGDLVALSWDNNTNADSTTLTGIIDSATGTNLVAQTSLVGDNYFDDVEDTSIASFSGGRLVLAGRNVSDGDVNVQTAQVKRVIQGDGANDTVLAASDMSHVLRGGGGLDKLTGGSLADTLEGEDGNDQLFGGAGDVDDSLYGGVGNDKLDGGAGADEMYGGAGNDTYTVEDYGDVIVEDAGGGTADTVRSSIDMVLAANIEKLLLLGTAQSGTGNGLNNTLTGNSAINLLFGGAGNDKLDGRGGGDYMEGGIGNDTYYVDSVYDSVAEFFGEGTDTVQSKIDYALGGHVEKLKLTGTDDLNGTGNYLKNTLTGNNGANVLLGLADQDTLVGGGGDDTLNGGTQKDKLTGGAGADKFVFDNLGTSADADTIADMVSGLDRIVLHKSVFTAFSGLAVGATINPGDFRLGTAAINANQNIIYDAGTGALYYDADGNGTGFAQVQIALLTGSPALSHTDIFIA